MHTLDVVIVVMGVSGAGKSTLGHALAAELGCPYADGDDFHPMNNLEAMGSGRALTEDDRRPWLRTMARWIDGQGARDAVLACSALKVGHRRTLDPEYRAVWFVHLARRARSSKAD